MLCLFRLWIRLIIPNSMLKGLRAETVHLKFKQALNRNGFSDLKNRCRYSVSSFCVPCWK